MTPSQADYFIALGKFLQASEGPRDPVFSFFDACEMTGRTAPAAEVEVALRVLRFSPHHRRGSHSVNKSAIESLTGCYLSQDALTVAAWMMGFQTPHSFPANWAKALARLQPLAIPGQFAPLPPNWDCIPRIRRAGNVYR